MRGLLVYFHCPSSSGYAIRSYERAFLRMAERVVPRERVHFAFTDVSAGTNLDLEHVTGFDPASRDPAVLEGIGRYIREHRIDFALGVDQPPGRPSLGVMRDAGVQRIVSYWGAPMSSLNRGAKLWARRIQYQITPHKPDAYIFESQAMADTATHGRGVPASRVGVVYMGVDAEVYRPAPPSDLLARRLGIPADRRVIVYSGHMEPRKGVAVLMRAANHLADRRSDFHFLICGNRPGEEQPYLDMLTTGRKHVTFAGYRDDLAEIMPQCYLGAIASTGWDSFTMSALELASCGVPLLVSNLQGLPETVEHGVTGYVCPVGDAGALSERISGLLDDPTRRARMSQAARQRIVQGFTLEHQTDALLEACGLVSGSSVPTSG